MSKPVEISVAKPVPSRGVKAPAPGREMALLKKAAKGEESCLPQVRELLSDPDRGAVMLAYCGSSAVWLREAIAQKASDGDLLVKGAIQERIDRVRAELEGPNPMPIERLLAERTSLCWHIANWYESTFINSDGHSIRQADYAQRRIDRAHRRFLSAVETLARVRRMALPSLMVNIARNQRQSRGDPRMSGRNGSLSPDQLRLVGMLARGEPDAAELADCYPAVVAGWLLENP